nr:DUF975 family protein [Clostridia bacterium]
SVAPLLLQFFTSNAYINIPLENGLVLQITSPMVWTASLLVGLFIVSPMSVSLCEVLIRFFTNPDASPAISPIFTCFDTGYTGLLRGMFWRWFKLELYGLLLLGAQIVDAMSGSSFFMFLPLAALILLINRSYAYCMTPYILAERPDISGRDALRLSCEITRGRIWELFYALGLSFIGWWLLGFVTFGFGFLYAIPYMRGVEAVYYLQMRPAAWGPVEAEKPAEEEPWA